MEEQKLALVLGALDECLENYSEDRKKRIEAFIDRHFSLQETFELQKKYISRDLLLNPLNALWSIPYLSLKKTVEFLDKVGFTKFTLAMELVPAGIKTGYQKEIENLIATELVDYNTLILELRRHPALSKFFSAHEIKLNETLIKSQMQKEIEKYSASQSMLADLSGSILTVLTGWYFFGDKSLGVTGIGHRIANKLAHDKAASGFVFGEKLGHTFYNLFPPVPTAAQVYLATIGVGVLLTILSVGSAVLSDPLRKSLGLHKKNLNELIIQLEEKLFLQIKKEIKASVRKNSQCVQSQTQAS